MTLAEKLELVGRLEGTTGRDIAISEAAGIELDELESMAADFGLERCAVCDWWHETGEIDEETGECRECLT